MKSIQYLIYASMFTLSTFPISLIVLFNVPLLVMAVVLARIARTMFYKDT